MNRSWILLCAGALLALIGFSFALTLTDQTASADTSGILPSGTPQPQAFVPGISVWDWGATPAVLVPGQRHSRVDVWWGHAQRDLTATPNWSAQMQRLAQLDQLGLKAVLAMPFFGEIGPPYELDILSIPTQLPRVMYYKACCNCYDQGLDYGSPVFREAYEDAVAHLGSTFANDPRIAAIYIDTGVDGEAVNVKNYRGCDDAQANFEAIVSPEAFLSFVEFAMTTWRKYFPNKAIFLHTGLEPTLYTKTYAANKRFMSYSVPTPGPGTPTPLWVGFSNEGWNQSGRHDYVVTGTPGPWGNSQTCTRQKDVGGCMLHTDRPIAMVPTVERRGMLYSTALSAVALGASIYEVSMEWAELLATDPVLTGIITKTLGTAAADSGAAFVLLRGSESPSTAWSTWATFSDYPGPYAHLMAVESSSVPDIYCVPSVYNEVQQWVASYPLAITPTPDYCRYLILSTPEPGNALRTTYRYRSDTVVGFKVADDWLHSNQGNQDYTIRVWYRDSCSGSCDTWSLKTYDADGTPRITTITKEGPDFWNLATFSLNLALANKGWNGADFELLTNGDGDEFFSLVEIEPNHPVSSTPTATPKPASPTPTATPQPASPTPTATASPILPTPTVTATPRQLVSRRAGAAPVLDGVLSEWGQPEWITVNWSTAEYRLGQTAPSITDIQVQVASLWNDEWLYFGLRAEDDQLYRDSGIEVWRDDGVELALDANNDQVSGGGDDHQFNVVADGTLREYGWATVPGGAIASLHREGGYDIEVALPITPINAGPFYEGRELGFTVGVVDDDDGGDRAGATDNYLIWEGNSTNTGAAGFGKLILGCLYQPPTPEPRPPDVTITISGAKRADVTLTWPHVAQDINGNPVSVTEYQVWRSESPYFQPSGAPYREIITITPTITFIDEGVSADMLYNYTYIVRAISSTGNPSANSNRAAEFTFGLVPGS